MYSKPAPVCGPSLPSTEEIKAQKKSMVNELLGSGGDVHYGQRPQNETHKKKELI